MKRKNQGFTLIELLFSITVLGVMLSLVMVTIVGMLRFYTFSNYIRENQQNGRNLMDSMTREVRFGTLVLPSEASPNGQTVLCVADTKNKQLIRYNIINPNTPDSGLVRSQYSYANIELSQVVNCDNSPGGATIVSENRLVSGTNMTVTNFIVDRTAGAPGTAPDKATAARIAFSYGTGSVNADGDCDPGDIYCSVLTLNTTVNIRGGGN